MNSSEYWAKREAEALKHRITDEKEYDKQIELIYSNMLDSCQKEINSFYGRYADKEGITLAEAKKRVTQLDIKEYERKAKRYVKDKDFSDKANEEMRLYNATMKINRLEMLKANLGLELISGTEELNKFMGDILKGRTEDELKRQAGILGETVLTNNKKAAAIVNASFHNATFSDRIWMYQDLLKADLSKLLQSGLIQGKNPRQLARELKKKFDTSTFNVERLMRTELARVQTEAQKQSFERNGFTEYEFIVNGGCCDICAGLSGKHFKVDKMMPGENAPPMHPHCRCSTAAYENSDDYNAWLKYLNMGGNTKTWDRLSAETKDKFKKSLTKSDSSSKIELKKSDNEHLNYLVNALDTLGVEYNEVKKHSKPLSSEQIIKTLGGGDQTIGSCASVGLAYIGQKGGLNVLDFRGGKSQNFFSRRSNIEKITQFPGVTTIRETARSEITAGNKLLKRIESGKEYYLVVGGHASIVRKAESGKVQYLELQHPTRNGWTDFNGNPRYTLNNRFGCRTTSYDASGFMIEVDTLKDNEDLKTLLGYINTAENEQRKGEHGTIK